MRMVAKMNNCTQTESDQISKGMVQQCNVLLNTFFIDSRKFYVLLQDETLIWENFKKVKTKIPISDVITVQVSKCTTKNITRNDKHKPRSLLPNLAKSATRKSIKKYIRIYYAQRTGNSFSDCNRWRKCSVTLCNSDNSTINLWYETITSILSRQNRPKTILLFINPYGGRKQALNIYHKYSKPLLQLAGVETHCIISQNANQIHDVIMTKSLEPYDAICCIGGDGTFAEVFNGMIYREIKDLKLNPLKPEYIPKPKLPIGVIPAGSTDTIAYCLHGTTDIKTAVIHIILGQTRGLDLCSMCNSSRLIRMYASVGSYGFLGDIALESEQYRWMGPKRYDYSGLKKIMSNQGYEGELSIYRNGDCEYGSSSTNDPEVDNTICCVNCEKCLNSHNRIKNSCSLQLHRIEDKMEYFAYSDYQNCTNDVTSNKWKAIKGKFFMISGANISCACRKAPNGFAPFSHLGDGYIDIIVVRHTTILNNFRLLLRLAKKKSCIGDLPFVETYRANKFNFRTPTKCVEDRIGGSCLAISNSTKASSSWNCDGEVVNEQDIQIRSHCQLIDVYMRGRYLPSVNNHSSWRTWLYSARE